MSHGQHVDFPSHAFYGAGETVAVGGTTGEVIAVTTGAIVAAGAIVAVGDDAAVGVGVATTVGDSVREQLLKMETQHVISRQTRRRRRGNVNMPDHLGATLPDYYSTVTCV